MPATSHAARSRNQSSANPQDPSDLSAIGRIAFDSALTDEQAEQFEAAQAELEPARRMALIALICSRQQLIDGFGPGDGPEALLDMIELVSDYEKHCKALAEIAEAAIARLVIAAAACIEKGDTE